LGNTLIVERLQPHSVEAGSPEEARA
jgi:hypothetical protein